MSNNLEFDFNAPKYHDFNSVLDDKDVDSFFDTDHEVTHSASSIIQNKMSPLPKVKQEIITPEAQSGVRTTETISIMVGNIKSENDTSIEKNDTPRVIRKAHRRISGRISTSATPQYNTEELINQAMENLEVKPEKKRRTLFEGISLSVPSNKIHSMVTRLDESSNTPKISLRSRSIIKTGIINENHKRQGSPTANTHQAKYMGMAERILHFERATPPRFHSKRKSDRFQKPRQSFIRSATTVAHSPNLASLSRNRPVEVQSQLEKEEIELEEIRRHQVKAFPLNKNIFKEPSIPVKESKPVTKPSPFNLTEVTKKPSIEVKPFHFTARPVPKAIFQTPAIKPLREKAVRVPVFENKDASYVLKQKEVALQGVKTHKTAKRFTEPKPFSFEERDKEMFKKKECKIKEYLEEEKRAREFHANPLPTFPTPKKNTSSVLSTVPDPPKFKVEERIHHRNEKENNKNEEEIKVFKAQPPTVLYKKPFEPKKLERPCTDPEEIELHTERRAKDREAFDLTVKEREQMLECLRRERDLKQKKEEEEKIAQLRKEATHKANPVPSFKIPVIEKSKKPLTEPLSPFLTRRCKDNNYL